MKHTKELFLSLGLFAILIVIFLGFTYAFFRSHNAGDTYNDVIVSSNTTDLLTFQISDDISFNVGQNNFYQNGSNVYGESTVTATLIPNNKTNQATMNYYMYLNLTSNPTVYSSTNINNDPELIVQVYDSNNQFVNLSGLGSKKTVKGVTGYDITGRQGLITLLDNHEIVANGSTKVETWRVVITMLNLDVDQLDNTNKEISGNLILQREQLTDLPRVAVVTPQKFGVEVVGYVEPLIENSIVDDEEVFTIYTVGYIDNDSIANVTYSIDIKNLNIDFSTYDLELVGTPQVMTTQNDFNKYVELKNNSLPIISTTNGDTTSAVATVQELYTYSLGTNELTINNIDVNCDWSKCVATISESFSDLSGKAKHNTVTNGGDSISVLYNGIKFDLKKVIKKNNIELLAAKYVLSFPSNITLTNGYIYYHDENLLNGARDGSYRYSGSNPNNYVCFGSNDTTCPANNLYRIIGIMPVEVIIDENSTPIETEIQYLYKLIRNDYENSIELGISNSGYATKASSYGGPSGNQTSGNIDSFDWTGVSSSNLNSWSESLLNTTGLNTNVYDSFGRMWQNKIANVVWIVGGNTWPSIANSTPMSVVYNNELHSSTTSTAHDGLSKYNAKIGLIYVSDYGYAAPQSSWTYPLYASNNSDYSLSSIKSNNWIYRGLHEWTITRGAEQNYGVFLIDVNGCMGGSYVGYDKFAVRRSFYLTEDTIIDMTNYDGTKTNPYRIVQ